MIDQSSNDFIEKQKQRCSETRDKLKSVDSNIFKNINQNVLFSKKQIDHSLYWKIVVQDFAKKLDDSAREKDLQKDQAIGFVIKKREKRLSNYIYYDIL